MWLYAVIIFYFYFLQICGTLYTGLIYSSLVLQFQVLCISDKVCSCFKKALLYTTLKAFSFCLFFHLGQWSPPGGGVSHQKETGLSFKGVSDRRQGRHWQLQHQSFAPSHTPGSSEESAAGKVQGDVWGWVWRRVILVNRWREEIKGIQLGHGISHGGMEKIKRQTSYCTKHTNQTHENTETHTSVWRILCFHPRNPNSSKGCQNRLKVMRN